MDSHGAFADAIKHRVAETTHQSAYRSLTEMSPTRKQSMGVWTGSSAAGDEAIFVRQQQKNIARGEFLLDRNSRLIEAPDEAGGGAPASPPAESGVGAK